MLTREEIIWGYRYILGQDSVPEADISQHMRTIPNWQIFRRVLLSLSQAHWLRATSTLPRRWVIGEVFGGQRLMWLNLNDDYVSPACMDGHYAPEVTAIIRKALKPGDVFLDVGANVGWFTMLASTLVGPTGHIVAFEPQRPTVDYLRRSVALNKLEDMVTVHDVALDTKAGLGKIGWRTTWRNPGHAFLIDADAPSEVETQPIKMQTLDQLALPRVDVMKIDVEGAEMRVLIGGETTITTHRPVILAELYPEQLAGVSAVTPAAFLAWLAARGYRAVIVDEARRGETITDFPSGWTKELVDILLLPDERPFADYCVQ